MSGATQEIRIGGEYKPAASGMSFFRRVKAIEDDVVYYAVVSIMTGNEVETYTSPVDQFRRLSMPNDQSPIPDLLAALKALERVVTELYPGGDEPDDEHLEEYRAVWNAVMNARAAIERAESGAK